MPDIKHILCPVDFSETSERALDYALVLAKHLGAKMSIIHAYSLPGVLMPDGALLPNADQVARGSVDAQAQLDQVAARITEVGVPFETKLVTGGPAEEIARLASHDRDDLVVMGTHGRTGFEHALMGSVAERVVRTSKVPVLTVRRPHDDDTKPSKLAGSITRVLCPVDFSETSAFAMRYAADLANRLGAELHLLHVHSTVAYAIAAESYTVKPDLLATLKQDVQRRVQELAESLKQIAGNVTYSLVEGVPYRAIHDGAHKQNADLIVMGTHGRTGFQHLFLGSVAERVIRTSTLPVLTVPPAV